MNIAIIPARSGSKRIKNKNTKLFYDKPIIAWSILNAKKSNIFDKIIVSTDSKKIKRIAQEYGASVPFLRSKKLSKDNVPTRDVILDLINYFDKKKAHLNFICCLYPTAPLLTFRDLKSAYSKLKLNKNRFVFAATEFSYPIQRSFYIKKTKVNNTFKIDRKKNSQSFKKTFHDAGQFYFATRDSFKKGVNIFSKNSFPIIYPNSKIQDINTMDDWKLCELKFKLLNEKKNYF